MKKNKTWDGDGVLSLRGGYANLQDISGKELGRTACKGPLLVGSELKIGGKDVEVENMISKEDFLAGRPFLGTTKQPASSLKEIDETKRVSQKAQAKHKKLAETQKDKLVKSVSASRASNGAFKAPLLEDHVQAPKTDTKVPVARHDPNAKGALVMKRPRNVPKGKQIVDVVVDPILTRNLRQHQREGVAFLYECVMGIRQYEGEGAILADEMGLGKTLQTIALLWTLLKQNPIYEEPPVVKKCLIVCPVTLISNWRREIRKWLGNERIGVFEANNKKMRLTDFTHGKCYNVMIIGYEKLRMVQADLQKCNDIDIVIADEGHRMKTAQNKSAQAIKSLCTDRRVILSGTPIQNNLEEFYIAVDFVNPNLLGKYNTFKREFETPILKSRQPGAAEKDLEKGEGRSEELANITSKFILRRTADILAQYLPPKTEYVLFCKPTEAQKTVYRSIVGSTAFNAAFGSNADALSYINVLKKVCNGPELLLKKDDSQVGATQAEAVKHVAPGLLNAAASGKVQVLDSLLHHIREKTDEKVVLISNYTQTLDILQRLLSALEYKYLRLDGSTPQNKRQELVERFNRSPPSNSFVFLLSAKAGGVGLNLIGASRLILFDMDWNPSTDLQAMARIHRDGQKRPCFIYRMLIQGALDEKIFQRQVSKTGLADSIVDGKNAVSSFSPAELRDIFTLDESEDCQTHKLLGCPCGGQGTPVTLPDDEQEDSSRNDLATLRSSDEEIMRDEDGTEILRLDDDDDKLPSFKAGEFKKGTQYNWQAEEAEIQRRKRDCKDSAGKAKMLSLMQYSHFDAALVDEMAVKGGDGAGEDEEGEGVVDPLEGVIEDAALRSVLRDGRRIGFVMSKLG